MAVYDLDELDRRSLVESSQSAIEAEKQCKIALAVTWPRAIKLDWMAGKGSRPTVILLEPGKSVTQPLNKTAAWFGPFWVPQEYAGADERRKEHLKEFWAAEKMRYLNRYDYPRPASMTKGSYEPIGPHRSPDVTITIIENDGVENPPIRLYELYKIGEFDPLKDTFIEKPSEEELKAKYEAELSSISDRYERQIQEMRLQLAEVKGIMLASGKAGK